MSGIKTLEQYVFELLLEELERRPTKKEVEQRLEEILKRKARRTK